MKSKVNPGCGRYKLKKPMQNLYHILGLSPFHKAERLLQDIIFLFYGNDFKFMVCWNGYEGRTRAKERPPYAKRNVTPKRY